MKKFKDWVRLRESEGWDAAADVLGAVGDFAANFVMWSITRDVWGGRAPGSTLGQTLAGMTDIGDALWQKAKNFFADDPEPDLEKAKEFLASLSPEEKEAIDQAAREKGNLSNKRS